ncbi:MAG: hypothetical protein ACRES5_21135 [Pseudomonas sp.]|uniref:hypothetical protein n=1 Tax=Stenotrophomonas sp. TaxID=69392 RepID=UPI003D6C8A4C
MKLNKPHRLDDPLHQFRMVIAGAVALLIMGCATTTGPVRLEDRSFANKLGLKNCKVSIPLSPSEAIEVGRKWETYPTPEKDPDWIKMLSMQQPGDELRLISCSEGNPYFYALIRNGAVIHRHLLPVLD